MVLPLLRLSMWVLAATPVNDAASRRSVRRIGHLAVALRAILRRGPTQKSAAGQKIWDADMCLEWLVVTLWRLRAHLHRVHVGVNAQHASADDLLRLSALPVRSRYMLRCCGGVVCCCVQPSCSLTCRWVWCVMHMWCLHTLILQCLLLTRSIFRESKALQNVALTDVGVELLTDFMARVDSLAPDSTDGVTTPRAVAASDILPLMGHQWLQHPGWTARVPSAVEGCVARQREYRSAVRDHLDVRWMEFQKLDAKWSAIPQRKALEEKGKLWMDKLRQLYVNARCTAAGLRSDAQCTVAALWRRTVRAVRHEHGPWADPSNSDMTEIHWMLRPHEDSQHRRFQLTRMYNYVDHSDAAFRSQAEQVTTPKPVHDARDMAAATVTGVKAVTQSNGDGMFVACGVGQLGGDSRWEWCSDVSW